jgi:hypothetical protein
MQRDFQRFGSPAVSKLRTGVWKRGFKHSTEIAAHAWRLNCGYRRVLLSVDWLGNKVLSLAAFFTA